jgi:hypothetical protein
MKVIAVRNPRLHPYAFHQVHIHREIERRRLIVKYRLARIGHPDETTAQTYRELRFSSSLPN